MIIVGERNMDLIEHNLWLGDITAATDFEKLNSENIYSILTVDAQPLLIGIHHKKNLVIKFIEAYDMPDEDLLSHFEETFDFIDKGLQRHGVLVHCFFGVSRSATIVLAYLMKKKQWTFEFALDHLKKKRTLIQPNAGFIAQLKLFQNMSCKLNENNIQYKMFRLFIRANRIKKLKELFPDFTDVARDEVLLKTIKSNSQVFRCRKCRNVLAHFSNVLPHVPREKYDWTNKRWSGIIDGRKICKEFYFIEPLNWMKSISHSFEGKLFCPNQNCKNKVGSFSWIRACLCPCGTEVCPGFYLIPSKVDSAKNF